MEKIFLNGLEITSQEGFHEQIAAALDFPQYYGKNLDALWDCLSEYAISMKGKEITIVIGNSDHVKKVVGADYFAKVVSCFIEARDECKVELHIDLE